METLEEAEITTLLKSGFGFKVKSWFYRVFFDVKIKDVKEEEQMQQIVENAKQAVETIKQRRKEKIASMDDALYNINESYCKYFNNISLNELYNNLVYILNLFKDDENLKIDLLDDVKIFYIDPLILLLEKAKKNIVRKTNLLYSNEEKFTNTLIDVERKYKEFNSLILATKEKEFVNQYLTKLRRFFKVFIYSNDNEQTDRRGFVYKPLEKYTKLLTFNLDKAPNHDANDIYLNVLKYQQNEGMLDYIWHSSLWFSIERKLYDIIRKSNASDIHFICSFSLNSINYEMLWIYGKTVFLNTNSSRMYIVENIDVDDIKNDKFTLEFEYKNKIEELNSKISDIHLDLAREVFLEKDVIDVLSDLNSKIINIDFLNDDANYDLELQQLKDLINSNIVGNGIDTSENI